jgi:signal recognition particle GTPase
VEQVNQLLEARKQMERMMKQMGRGKMPGLPAAEGATGSVRSATRKPSSKRKKRKSGRR